MICGLIVTQLLCGREAWGNMIFNQFLLDA